MNPHQLLSIAPRTATRLALLSLLRAHCDVGVSSAAFNADHLPFRPTMDPCRSTLSDVAIPAREAHLTFTMLSFLTRVPHFVPDYASSRKSVRMGLL